MFKLILLRRILTYLTGGACLLVPAACYGQFSSFNISTAAGNHTQGYIGDGGAATSAELNGPIAVTVSPSGDLYIADSLNNKVRKVSGGKISTVAGSGSKGFSGDGGPAANAILNTPYGVVVDRSGNVYISDLANNVVREVTTNGNISTFAGNTSYNYSGDGGPATSASMAQPFGLALDAAGNLYIADSVNHRIRKVSTDGIITTVAGNGTAGFSGDGGPAIRANLNRPCGIGMDGAGNLYIADSSNNRIRKVTPDGTISTVAGTGVSGFSGDGGPALSAQLSRPFGVTADAGGDLYITDYNNSRIRLVTAAGVISTVAGRTGFDYAGDGGPATSALLNFPTGVALDAAGKVYIADADNNVVRLLSPLAPAVNAGGVVSAPAFGGASTIAPGSWIEIYGTNLAGNQRSWANDDFKGAAAPTSLDGTTVTIGGQSAYVGYISGGQVNVQVPSVGAGTQQLSLKNAGGTSANYSVTVSATQPGLLAPPTFQVNGTQYVTAMFTDGVTYVLPPGAIAGVPARRAKAGDTIVLYGIGFGPVTPDIPPGQVVQQSNALAGTVRVLFGQTPATVTYAGMSGDSVGLYQFNVTVPNVSAGDAVPLTFTLDGVSGTQTLYTSVQ